MKTKQFGRVKEFSNKRQKKDMKYKKFVGNKVEGNVSEMVDFKFM